LADNKKIMSATFNSTVDVIFQELKLRFPDYAHAVFPQIEMALKAAIGAALTAPTMTSKDVLNSAHNYVCFRKCSTEEQKTFVGAVEFIFQIAHLLSLSKRYENTALQWMTTQELVAQYPSFENLSTVELALLLKFRNAIKVVLTVFPAYRNKATILRFAGKLEGVNKTYITGTGQSAEVDRRVAIYEKEGGVVAARRLEARKRKVNTSNETSANPRKRGREANLDSALINLLLPSATPDDFPIHAALGQQPGGTPAAAPAIPQYFYAPVTPDGGPDRGYFVAQYAPAPALPQWYGNWLPQSTPPTSLAHNEDSTKRAGLEDNSFQFDPAVFDHAQ
jgi:hypothetical protein